MDPLSVAAQQVASLLLPLRELLPLRVTVLLKPTPELDTLPLDTFYSFAMPPAAPKADGTATAEAVLVGLPEQSVLTMSLHVPEAWLVEVRGKTAACVCNSRPAELPRNWQPQLLFTACRSSRRLWTPTTSCWRTGMRAACASRSSSRRCCCRAAASM